MAFDKNVGIGVFIQDFGQLGQVCLADRPKEPVLLLEAVIIVRQEAIEMMEYNPVMGKGLLGRLAHPWACVIKVG